MCFNKCLACWDWKDFSGTKNTPRIALWGKEVVEQSVLRLTLSYSSKKNPNSVDGLVQASTISAAVMTGIPTMPTSVAS